MPKSAAEFARLLSQAIKNIAQHQGKKIMALQDELGYELGRETGGSTIQYWRKGNVPAKLEQVEKLALALEKRRGFASDKALHRFLASAGHPYPEQFCKKIFSNAQPLPPLPSAPLHHPAPLPQLGHFYGRQNDLHILQTWLASDQLRLLGIFALGGQGKSSLAIKLAQTQQNAFEYIGWYSLKLAPPLPDLLDDIIQSLPGGAEQNTPLRLNKQLPALLKLLQQHRCLLILDNLETLLLAESVNGQFKPGYKDYALFLEQIGQAQHQSILLLTGREKPACLSKLDYEGGPMGSYHLQGLDSASAINMLQTRGLQGQASHYTALIEGYSGNPLALNLIAETIKTMFQAQIAPFLKLRVLAFGDIAQVLAEQFARLSPLEAEIITWLAIEQAPVSVEKLAKNFIHPILHASLLEALQALHRRCLIESGPQGFGLQNVILEYTLRRLIKQLSADLLAHNFSALNRYALMQAQASEYLRQSQIRLIVQALLAELSQSLPQPETVVQYLLLAVAQLRQNPLPRAGYAGGNLLNMLIELKADLTGLDFSDLPLWQADLRQVRLEKVNFRGANLGQALFTSAVVNTYSLAFSPDGEQIICGLENGQLQIWGVADGQLRQKLDGHEGYVPSISPSPGQNLVASIGADGLICVWEPLTWQCVRRLEGNTMRCRELAFSPDGQFIASTSEDGQIRLWEVATGRLVTVLQQANQPYALAFHPQGQFLLTTGLNGQICVWDWQTGQVENIFFAEDKGIRCLSFSPNGHHLLGGGDDGNLYLWTWPNLNQPHQIQAHSKYVRRVLFSPDGQTIISGGEDGTIRFYHSQSKQCYRIIQTGAGRVWNLALSQDGSKLISSGESGALHLWQTSTGRCLRAWHGYKDYVMGICFSGQGDILASGHTAATIQLWSVKTWQVQQNLKGHHGQVSTLAFNQDDSLLASGAYDNLIKLWDVQSGRCLKTFSGHQDWVRSVLFSPDGRTLISCSDDKTIRLWDISTGQCRQILEGHEGWIWGGRLSQDGRYLVTASADSTLRVWDWQTGDCIQSFAGHKGQVWAVDWSLDGQYLVSAGQDFTVRLWSVAEGICLRVLQGADRGLWTVRFSPDQKHIIAGGEEGKIFKWHVQTGQPQRVWEGHQDLIYETAFHPSGQILVTGGFDSTLKAWAYSSFSLLKTLHAQRPYEGLNIQAVQGLTDSQKQSLQALGAVAVSATSWAT